MRVVGEIRAPQILDGVHQRIMTGGLKRVLRVQPMLTTYQTQNGVALTKDAFSVNFREWGSEANGKSDLILRKSLKVDPVVVERHAREIKSEPHLFASAAGENRNR